MTDRTHPETAPPASSDSDRVLAIINYVLFLIGPATLVPMLVGLLISYMRKDAASDWMSNHFIFQIRTFWWWLLFVVAGVVTTPILIGFPILLLATVWVIVRAVVGLVRVADGRGHPDPRTLLI